MLGGLGLRSRADEQELDEGAAHIGTFGIGRTYGRGRLRLSGVDHIGIRERRAVERRGLVKSCTKQGGAGEQRDRNVFGKVFEHGRTLYCFVSTPIIVRDADRRLRTW